MKQLAYIASPVGIYIKYYGQYTNQCNVRVRANAARNANYAKEQGYIPVSPVLCFIDIYNENDNEISAFNDGIKILETCRVFVYDPKELSLSPGIEKELEIAKQRCMEIIEIPEDYEWIEK